MPSPEGRGPRWLLLGLGLGMAGLNVWVTLARSTIPARLQATVIGVEVLPEKHPGVDDVWMVTLDGERFQADRAVAQHLAPGQRVEKAAWSRALQVDGHAVPLSFSADAHAMWIAMPLLVLLTWALLRFGVRTADDES